MPFVPVGVLALLENQSSLACDLPSLAVCRAQTLIDLIEHEENDPGGLRELTCEPVDIRCFVNKRPE